MPEKPDNISPEQQELDLKALDFILSDDPESSVYSEVRTVFGRFSMKFRILSATEMLQADVVANSIEGDAIGARAIEREIQWIQMSLLAIGKKGQETKPVKKDMLERTKWISEWPYSLLSSAVKEYMEVENNFRKICDPESIKNLPGEPETHTA